MPEIETTQDQPVVAEETPYVPSFLRDEEPEPDAEATPALQTAEGEEPLEADSAEAESETTEPRQTESPSQDEFLATLDPAEIAYYAKRYPTLYRAYQDPAQPADLRQAFVDRVNQDHAYAELRDGNQQEEEDEVPTLDTKQPADASEQRTAYYAQIDDIIATQIDPEALKQFGASVLSSMGVDLNSKDPEIAAIVRNAPIVGQALAKGAVDLMATVLPHLLPTRLEASMPQITEMYYDNLRSRTWEQMRNQTVTGPTGIPAKPYAKLPAMGTPQWDAAVDKVLKEMPELREMFDNLQPQQRFQKQYSIAMKLMTGQRVNPALVAQAVETGKKQARQADMGRAARKALGGGKTQGDVRAGGGGNDDIFGPGMEEYKRRGG